MANRFESPIQQPEYVQQTIPLPFQELAQIGAMRQKAHDVIKSDISKTADDLSQIETRPIKEDIQTKNVLVKSYLDEAQNILSKYGNDIQSAQPELNQIKRKYASSPFWQYNKAYVDQYKKSKTELDKQISEGKQMVDFDTSIFDKPIFGENGEINRIGYDVQAQLNHGEIVEKLANDLKASMDESGLRQAGLGYLKNKSIEELSEEDIRNYVNNPYVIDTFKRNDPQFVRILTQKQGVKDPDQLNQSIAQFIYGNIIDKKIRKEDSKYLKDILAEEDRAKEEVEREVTYTPTPVTTKLLTNIDKPKFDKSGNVISIPSKSFEQLTSYEKGKVGVIPGSENKEDKKINQTEFINSLKSKYKLKGTPEEVYDTWDKARNNFSKQVLVDINPSGQSKEALYNQLIEDVFTRSVNLEGGNPDIHVMEGKGGVMEQLGYDSSDPEDRETFIKSIKKDIKIQPLGTYSGSNVIQVPDKDGNTQRIYVEPDINQQRAFSRTHYIGKEFTKLIDDPNAQVQPIQIGSLTYVPNINLDEDSKSFDLKVDVYQNNQIVGNYSLDDIYNSDVKNYIGSNAVRSKLTTTKKQSE